MSADGASRTEKNAGRLVCEVSLPVSEPLPAALQKPVSSGQPVRLQQDTQGAHTFTQTHFLKSYVYVPSYFTGQTHERDNENIAASSSCGVKPFKSTF